MKCMKLLNPGMIGVKQQHYLVVGKAKSTNLICFLSSDPQVKAAWAKQYQQFRASEPS